MTSKLPAGRPGGVTCGMEMTAMRSATFLIAIGRSRMSTAVGNKVTGMVGVTYSCTSSGPETR